MARSLFGGGTADFLAAVGPGGTLRALSGNLTLWTAESGGTQHTDLLLNGSPVTSIAVDRTGQVPRFQGPNGVTDLWADAGGDGRVRMLADVVEVVEQAVQDHTPGIELGYASRTSSITSTATTSTGATALVGLSVTVTGQGRPVDLRFFCPSIYHTTANAGVSVVIVRDGNVTGGDNQIGARFSPVTTTGPSLSITRRTATLVDGVSYTFTVRAWGTVAGTCTLVGAPFCPIELTVTSR